MLMAVEVTAGATFAAGDPKPLFATRRRRYSYSDRGVISREYDVSSDGFRFLVNNTLSEENVPPITLILNWSAALKR